MSPQDLQPEQPRELTLEIKCHWCGHTGVSVWEETAAGKALVDIQGFYERVAKKQPFNIETVCNSCNRTQPI